MIHRGRKVLDAPIAAIRSRHDTRALVLEPLDPGTDVAAHARHLTEVERCERADRGYEITLRTGTNVSAVMQRLIAALPLARIELKRPRLEDVFIELVGRDSRSGSADQRELRAELQGAAGPGGAL
jgi:ABC-type uncharacterized transport system ATPase subunit